FTSNPDYVTPDDAQVGGSSEDCPDQSPPATQSSGDFSGMARYSFNAMLVSLKIADTPLWYAPPRGPKMAFQVSYNQLDAAQPGIFTYTNLGPYWTLNWLSYVTDDPNYPVGDAALYVQGGGAERYHLFNNATQSYAPQMKNGAVLVRL